MAKLKKEIDLTKCWNCGYKMLMVSNEGKMIHCPKCGHGVEMKESIKNPGKFTARRY